MVESRICAECRDPLSADRRRDARFCTDVCRMEAAKRSRRDRRAGNRGERACRHCGRGFSPTRAHAVYCSSACKVGAFARRHRLGPERVVDVALLDEVFRDWRKPEECDVERAALLLELADSGRTGRYGLPHATLYRAQLVRRARSKIDTGSSWRPLEIVLTPTGAEFVERFRTMLEKIAGNAGVTAPTLRNRPPFLLLSDTVPGSDEWASIVLGSPADSLRSWRQDFIFWEPLELAFAHRIWETWPRGRPAGAVTAFCERVIGLDATSLLMLLDVIKPDHGIPWPSFDETPPHPGLRDLVMSVRQPASVYRFPPMLGPHEHCEPGSLDWTERLANSVGLRVRSDLYNTLRPIGESLTKALTALTVEQVDEALAPSGVSGRALIAVLERFGLVVSRRTEAAAGAAGGVTAPTRRLDSTEA